MGSSFETWAKDQLSRLLPLDEESLKELVNHTQSLSKDAASENLKSLLGDSPQAFEFIASFNLRRPNSFNSSDRPSASSQASQAQSSIEGVPRPTPRPKKKRANLHALPARQVEDNGEGQRVYKKDDEDDYMPGKRRTAHSQKISGTLALSSEPDAKQVPTPSRPTIVNDGASATHLKSHAPKPPPSAAGKLISDSAKSSRSSSPVNKTNAQSTSKTKVNVTGGTSMRGASTTLSELESVIRSLEIQTDPTLAANRATETNKRRCNCQAQRHALLAAAPNCLSCGKIICAKEGLGPCTFCGYNLLSSSEVQAMLQVLKEERGKERMNQHNIAHKKADVSRAPRPSASSNTTPGSSVPASGSASDTEGPVDKSLGIARAHRDRLLNFQAENAKRTQIHDEAADFETPDVGLSMWASPLERAQQLKRQQKVLREQEWNSRQDYEKRKMVMSIDVKGGKAVKRMQEISRDETEMDTEDEADWPQTPDEHTSTGAGFARNPLLGELIRPVYQADGAEKGKDKARERQHIWRRVQDDNEDNEQWILDGGAYGDRDKTVLSTEEPACG